VEQGELLNIGAISVKTPSGVKMKGEYAGNRTQLIRLDAGREWKCPA